ncbi:hypothetical protein O3M35_009953 [Rhynocoris fuscipes]|uniref:3-beta hydroxysteroid dehydrogenase/isomerase domain-containing protein n=1 Tax=Rhynocoris fuscipes TaxID=488301 RepID=A0AAW1D019_9HEMI
MTTDCAEAFRDVSTVFHCAAYVSYEFPSNFQKLQANNVQGTKNVIEHCLMNNVSNLIYTSTAEVCMKPYFRNAFFSIIINQSEAKIPPPNDRRQLIFGDYAESKLMAEKLILEADNQQHFSGKGRLRTTALRPTFMYGEEDKFLIPTILNISKKLNNQIWRIGGSGGRHQFVYVGNVAWAHICAKRVLDENADSIGGLPIFITDDTNITDLLYFSKNLCNTKDRDSRSVTTSSWYIPVLLSYFLFLIFETVYKYLSNVFTLPNLPISPKSFVIYLGSVIFFSRLRAIISLDYIPIYSQDEAHFRSKLFYNKLLQNECNKIEKDLVT